jgi:hypothetical protein
MDEICLPNRNADIEALARLATAYFANGKSLSTRSSYASDRRNLVREAFATVSALSTRSSELLHRGYRSAEEKRSLNDQASHIGPVLLSPTG